MKDKKLERLRKPCQGCKKLRKVFDVYISVSEKFDKCIDCFRDEYPAPDDDGIREIEDRR